MRNKICKKRGQTFPATLKYFPPDKRIKSGLKPRCRKCGNQEARQYRKNHPKESRESALKQAHGFNSIEIFNDFFAQQKGICPGCERHQTELKRHLCLDHDHETGEYRGLLCWRCNSIAGSSKKDLQVLKNIVKYLEKFYKETK